MTYPQLDIENYKGTTVTICTNLGNLTLRLFDELAPQTVKNFISLAKKGYYDDVIFHRVITDFMIQGGDPTGTGMGGESIYGSVFEDEFSDELFNIRGALSMANAGPNTNGSQFFIVQNSHIDYPKSALVDGGWPEEIAEAYVIRGGTPHLDNHHTVFGQILDKDSYAILDRIAAVSTDANNRPIEEVKILTIDVRPVSTRQTQSDHGKVQMFINKDHKIRIGDDFEAEVIGIQSYGAFVKFDGNKKGLVHISEIRSGFIKNINDEVKIGQKLHVQVIDSDEYSGKISLSMRTLEGHPQVHYVMRKHFATNNHKHIGFSSLEKEMPDWIRENEKYLENTKADRKSN